MDTDELRNWICYAVLKEQLKDVNFQNENETLFSQKVSIGPSAAVF